MYETERGETHYVDRLVGYRVWKERRRSDGISTGSPAGHYISPARRLRTGPTLRFRVWPLVALAIRLSLHPTNAKNCHAVNNRGP